LGWKYLKRSKAQILAHKLVVKSFTPAPGGRSLHGLDFGFSQDPPLRCAAGVDNRLYVEYESGGVGIELDHTVATIGPEIPNIAAHVIRADSARPESISYLKRHGWPRVEACKKWQGSVEDGIAHLLTYSEIVVHERCTEVAKECRTYAYKVDRLTGEVCLL